MQIQGLAAGHVCQTTCRTDSARQPDSRTPHAAVGGWRDRRDLLSSCNLGVFQQQFWDWKKMEIRKPKTLEEFPKFEVTALRRGPTTKEGYSFATNNEYRSTLRLEIPRRVLRTGIVKGKILCHRVIFASRIFSSCIHDSPMTFLEQRLGTAWFFADVP